MAFQKAATPRGRVRRQAHIRRSVGNLADAMQDIEGMCENILTVWNEADDSDYAAGCRWYSDAYAMAVRISDYSVHGHPDNVNALDPEQVVGIMAVLSPSTDWDRNVKLAHDMVMTGDCSHAYGLCIERARAIREGEPVQTVLGGRKVRSFYNCIMAQGQGGHVVVDRHAHAIALGVRAPLGDWAAAALDKPGRYQVVAAAYRYAARCAGISPAHMQATTWLHFRREYAGRGGRGYTSNPNHDEEF